MRVMPPTLMLLMRHESIQTTQAYYIGRNAEAAADAVWDAVANSFANTVESSGVLRQAEMPESPVVSRL